MPESEFPIDDDTVDELHEALVDTINEYQPSTAELALAIQMAMTSHTEAQRRKVFPNV